MRCTATILLTAALNGAPIPESLRSSLTFHASFDHGVQADTARGDKQIYHAPGYKEQSAAKTGVGDLDVAVEKGAGAGSGAALRFRSRNTRALFFKGERHVSPAAGTFSFWLRLDPQKDLAPGFSDPIQITDKAYNDSAIWVDFSKDETPRHFRLGVFGSLSTWNPKNVPPDKNPQFMERLVVVERPPFGADRWTHIVITWSGLNARGGSASLFLNGKRTGTEKKIAEPFEWSDERLAIRLGVNYTGLMDELAAFDRVFSDREITAIYEAAAGKR